MDKAPKQRLFRHAGEQQVVEGKQPPPVGQAQLRLEGAELPGEQQQGCQGQNQQGQRSPAYRPTLTEQGGPCQQQAEEDQRLVQVEIEAEGHAGGAGQHPIQYLGVVKARHQMQGQGEGPQQHQAECDPAPGHG
ncbi:hypothetical protein D3C79_800640 [compost metagenome]